MDRGRIDGQTMRRAAVSWPSAAGSGRGPRILTLHWRILEWWGVVVCLFLQTGAVFVLLAVGMEGDLSSTARTLLRALSLPVYLITAVLIAPHLSQGLIAMRRNLPMLVLLLLPFLSVLWSVGPSTSLRRAVGLLGSVALAYLVALRFTPRQMLLLVAWAVVPSILLSLVIIPVLPGLAFMPAGHELRGVFPHKNILGRFAVLACLVTAVLAADPAYGRRRLGGVLLAASVVALLLSQSVTALFTGCVALALAAVNSMLARRHGLNRVIAALLILQIALAFLLFLEQLLVPLLESLGKDATLTGRVPLWQLVDERIGRHLILGFGYQAFWTAGSPDAWAIWSEIGWMAPNAHSGYRETLLGLGVVGMAVLLLLVARSIWQGTSLHCGDPGGGWLWMNAFVGLFVAMNLTESMFMVQNDIFWTLFMTCAIAFSLRTKEQRAGLAASADPGARHAPALA